MLINWLRFSFALIFIWYGALKLAGFSPVSSLLIETFSFLDPKLVINLTGIIEVLIGIGFIVKPIFKYVKYLFLAQMLGTFAPIFLAFDKVFQTNNILLLTGHGEFIFKNLILIPIGFLILSEDKIKS